MKIEYYEEMLEQEAINKYLNMIANDYNGELAQIFEKKYINKGKEIERLKEENTNLKLMLEDEKKRRLSSEKLFSNYRLHLIREQNKITKKCLIEKNERLNNIIKEVREYIEEWQKFPHTNGSTHKELKNLIDILDKGE